MSFDEFVRPLRRWSEPPLPSAVHRPDPPRLDLGSGPHPAEGYVGVDRLEGVPNVLPWDFASWKPWPFESESIEALHSSHLIEHLPPLDSRGGRDALIRFFEEAWRVARPGALFRLRWPCPFHPTTGAPLESAWWDPTHYRIIPWMQIATYFSTTGRASMGVQSYGIACNWVMSRDVALRPLTESGDVLEYDAELRREAL